MLIEGSVIVSKIQTIDSFGYCLYGADMKETVLLEMVSELYKVKLDFYIQKIIQETVIDNSGDTKHSLD